MNLNYENCKICPRECGVNRTVKKGACGENDKMRVAKIMLHYYEEPPVSGTRGSGAIFFTGCALRCGYCQNAAISHGKNRGEIYSAESLADAALKLQKDGAHNINLVTAGHFLPEIIKFLHIVRPQLKIPVVYNSSGYEKAEAIRALEGLVDVYLPDFKYTNPETAKKYSAAEDYPSVALSAITEMVRQTGDYKEENGIAVRGTIIRHLVLPSLSHEGELIMRRIARLFPSARVSIMSQYTPQFNQTGDSALSRKITALEYNRVLKTAQNSGLLGFKQLRDSATSRYTPDFEK